jgi:hypothetical protein
MPYLDFRIFREEVKRMLTGNEKDLLLGVAVK